MRQVMFVGVTALTASLPSITMLGCPQSLPPPISPEKISVTEKALHDQRALAQHILEERPVGPCLDVPGQYPTVEAALLAAHSGDIVCVAPGIYREDIDFAGKSVWLMGSGADTTILHGTGTGPVVTLYEGDGERPRISGFTITGGRASHGAGLLIIGASPVLEDLVITGNTAAMDTAEERAPAESAEDAATEPAIAGSGVYLDASDALLSQVRIVGNTASLPGRGLIAGAAVFVRGGRPTLLDTEIARNTVSLGHGAELYGGGLYLADTGAFVLSCVLGHTTVTAHRAKSVLGIGAFVTRSKAWLDDVEIAENRFLAGSSATTVLGAGLYLGHASPRLHALTVQDNAIEGDGVQRAAGAGVAMLRSHPYATHIAVTGNSIRKVGHSAGVSGAGVYLWRASPTLVDSRIAHNSIDSAITPAAGGGMYLDTAHPHLIRVAIEENAISAAQAAAYGAGLYMTESNAELTQVAIAGQTALSSVSAYGGGVYVTGGKPVLRGVTISGNEAAAWSGAEGGRSYGGGLYASGSAMALDDITFAKNLAEGISLAWGGALYLEHPAAGAAYTRLTLESNTALTTGHGEASAPGSGSRGGGVYIAASVPVTFRHLAAIGNAAVSHGPGPALGGGMYMDASAQIRIIRASICGNTASVVTERGSIAHGGGIYSADAPLSLVNIDLSGNRADGTGLAGGVGLGHGGGLYASGQSPAISYSNAYDNVPNAYADLIDPTGQQGNLSVHPGYVDRSAKTGTDRNLTLAPDSALKDAGDPSLLDSDGSVSDIGAFSAL